MTAPALASPARGTALVFPGRTEFIEKYFEVARDLQRRGFEVVVFDWPGQGLSARMLPDPTVGHVSHFDVFVDALRRGLEVIGDRTPKPVVLVAHSMGGAIGFEALRQKVIAPKAAAFSAPMLGLRIAGLSRAAIGLMASFGMRGRAARPPGPKETFATNNLTHDETRWRVYHDCVAAEPGLALGQPSIGWVAASLRVTAGFFKPGAVAHLSTIPILIASAGSEQLVDNRAHDRMARTLSHIRQIKVAGAYHEILMEQDALRDQFWAAFDALLAEAGV
ncbi:alpha/beta fold hydrolase [bacterium]|nr:alpha/beta fold hydrolase [bacterium]